MTEELKIIAEIFKTATDGALYAYIAYLLFYLGKVAIIVFPIVHTIKYIVSRIFVDETKKD